MYKKPQRKYSSFTDHGYTYQCTIEYYGIYSVAPYKLTVIEGDDLLIIDSDFHLVQESTGLDIFKDFDEICQTDQFQQMVINSMFWEYNYPAHYPFK